MKKYNLLFTRYFLLITICLFFINFTAQAQSKKQNLRLSLSYAQLNNDALLKVLIRNKTDNGYEPTANIPLNFYQNFENDSTVLLGNGISKENGQVEFLIKNYRNRNLNQNFDLNYSVEFEGNDSIKSATKDIDIEDIDLSASLIETDSTFTIQAVLSNPKDSLPIANQNISLKLKRLFKPLPLSEELLFTDEDGEISHTFSNNLFSADGNLTFEVTIDESDTFGTVIENLHSEKGMVSENENSFFERTMWGSRSKTPIFLLIFPNLIIFGVWGTILYLIFNLFKIYKS